MKRAKFFFVNVIIISVVMLTGNITAQEYTLKYSLPENTEFTLINTSDVEQLMNQMGNEISTLIKGGFEGAVKVLKSDPEKGISMEMEYKDMTQTMESAMGGGSSDFTELIGKKVNFTLSPIGKIIQTEGFDKLPEITLVNQEKLREETYLMQVSGNFMALPEKPVKPGATWTDELVENIPMPGDGNLKVTTHFTYKLLEQTEYNGFNCVKINAELSQTLSGNFEQQGMLLTMDMKGKGNGTIYFAYEKGMVINSETTSLLDGVVFVEAAGMEIPIVNESKSTTVVKF